MASDSAGTLSTGLSFTVGQQDVTKIVTIKNAILYSSTGSIGMSQLIASKIGTAWNEQAFFLNATPPEAMHKIGTAIAQAVGVYAMNAQAFQQAGGLGGAMCRSLVALPLKDGPRLFQFDFSGAPEEATKELPFIALGSGQQIADPFLAFLKRILWKERQPTIAEGRLVAAWTVRHVAQTNPGGVALPLQMASLTIKGATPAIELVEDPAEHFQKIETAETALREEVLSQGKPAEAEIKETPPPPEPPKQS
jgi:Proteasome subunit